MSTFAFTATKWKHFNTLTEFVDGVRALPLHETDHAGDDWAGGSQEQAEHLALYGWPEGVRQAGAMATRIANRVAEATGNNSEIALEYDVTGAGLDVGSYLTGIPECWIKLEPQTIKRAVYIQVNAMASGGVPQQTLMKRGIAVSALVMALQSNGYPVTVDIVHSARKVDLITIRVIDASTGSQMDIDRAVYAMAHPTMLRRLCRSYTNQFRGGDKASTHWDSGIAWSDATTSNKPDIFLGGSHLYQVERWTDGGEQWIIEEYKRQTASA